MFGGCRMNILLSVYSGRVSGLSGYVIYKNGVSVNTYSRSFVGDNIKENVLDAVSKGLTACKEVVNHDDILYIEVQNSHVCDWLNGQLERSQYNEYLDKAFTSLERLDCRYKFVYNNRPKCQGAVNAGKSKVIGSSFSDIMNELK